MATYYLTNLVHCYNTQRKICNKKKKKKGDDHYPQQMNPFCNSHSTYIYPVLDRRVKENCSIAYFRYENLYSKHDLNILHSDFYVKHTMGIIINIFIACLLLHNDIKKNLKKRITLG